MTDKAKDYTAIILPRGVQIVIHETSDLSSRQYSAGDAVMVAFSAVRAFVRDRIVPAVACLQEVERGKYPRPPVILVVTIQKNTVVHVFSDTGIKLVEYEFGRLSIEHTPMTFLVREMCSKIAQWRASADMSFLALTYDHPARKTVLQAIQATDAELVELSERLLVWIELLKVFGL